VTPAGLRVSDLAFAYPGGPPVFQGVSFTVTPGERVAVLGANGTGKSTLLLHLNGLLTPSAGEVTVNGITVRDGNLREVRSRVGFVFQDPDDQLFLPTLIEDVACGPLNQGLDRKTAGTAARRQLESFGLLDAADRAAHHLSGGEKRLAALATVLVLSPSVLVLDEPTAALDARSRARVVRTLARRTETLLIATHDLEVAGALCRRALVLADGRLALDSPADALLADPALLHRFGLRQPLSV
jgi:cobalt/nickel transport system ATP-binding protein